MSRIIIAILITTAVIGGSYQLISRAETKEDIDSPTPIEDQGPEVTIKSYMIQEDDTFTSSMEELEIPYSEALEIVTAAKEVFDFTKIKLGKTFNLIFEDGIRNRLEYEPNSEIMIVVDLTSDEYATTETNIPYDLSITTAEVTIENSMFLSGIEAGLEEILILNLADIFAWEIDFATQVQTGDSFKVMYEKRSRNGIESGVGDILTASFTNVGETSYAFRYSDLEGRIAYYNEKGESLVRQFLKAPVSYSRITSGFTNNRFHPTLNRNMPHRAIDYAAAAGTPVMAVADGVVTFAGRSGCFGNMVDIRHNSTYETQYAHNSVLLVRAGDRVKQGDIIAKVGTTGCSTGNHVHYQVKVNGVLVNPLEIEFPAGDAVAEDQFSRFEEQRDALKAKFN